MMDEKTRRKFKERVLERMKLFAKEEWLGKISFQDVERWIKNFPENSLTPYLLLDCLIIVTSAQVDASIYNIIGKIKSSVYAQNMSLSDEELKELFIDHLNHSIFMCAFIPGDATSSAPIIGHAFRDILKKHFVEETPSNLCKTIAAKDIRNVYIIDDFVGTGKQMTDYLNHTEICSEHTCSKEQVSCTVSNIMSAHTDVQFTILPIVLHKSGYTKLTEIFSGLNIITANDIDESYNLLSNNCTLYFDTRFIEEIVKDVKSLTEHYGMSNEYALHLPIGFNDAFPNNALELFWWTKSEGWSPLLQRVDDANFEQ